MIYQACAMCLHTMEAKAETMTITERETETIRSLVRLCVAFPMTVSQYCSDSFISLIINTTTFLLFLLGCFSRRILHRITCFINITRATSFICILYYSVLEKIRQLRHHHLRLLMMLMKKIPRFHSMLFKFSFC